MSLKSLADLENIGIKDTKTFALLKIIQLGFVSYLFRYWIIAHLSLTKNTDLPVEFLSLFM